MINKLASIDIGKAFFERYDPIFRGVNHDLQNLNYLSRLITFAINLSFVIAGLLVLIIGLVGGFQVIVGAGSGNPESAAKGKMAVTYAIMGFIIIFVAYWIVRFLEVVTQVNFVTNPPF